MALQRGGLAVYARPTFEAVATATARLDPTADGHRHDPNG